MNDFIKLSQKFSKSLFNSKKRSKIGVPGQQPLEEEQIFRDAYNESATFLKSLIAGEEYNSIEVFASSVNRENYRRLFTRDAFWVGADPAVFWCYPEYTQTTNICPSAALEIFPIGHTR